MIPYCAYFFSISSCYLNLLRYVTVRSIIALLCALGITLVTGRWWVAWLAKWSRTAARAWTPSNHQSKHNTPTMGGLMIGCVALFVTLLWARLSTPIVWNALLCYGGFMAIGFYDDWSKIVYKRGISARTKTKAQVFVATVTMVIWFFFVPHHQSLCIPFIKSWAPDFGWWIIPWGVLVIVASSNAVNLTDGLDGLAGGTLMTSYTAMSIVCYLAGNSKIAAYLYIPYAHTAELTLLGATVVGALMGFLWYNAYPAQIFMGDVGALPLGALLGFMAVAARQELLFMFAGAVFVVETISVILQVLSFRLTGKRIFLMAPLHHHFEMKGIHEVKVTMRFWIVAMVCMMLALLSLKFR